MTELSDRPLTDSPRGSRAPWIGLAIAIVLLAAAMIIPAVTGWNVRVRSFPPLHAEWMPRLGFGTIPVVVLGVLAVRFGAAAASYLRWNLLLAASFVASALWLASLALVDGPAGIGVILDHHYEYLRTARSVTDFSATLNEYVSRIPLDSVNNWPVHIAGHPPGALLFFVVLVQLGLGSGLAAGIVVLLFAATVPAAVLITLRRLGAEGPARVVAPFLVFGPSAIWMAVSGDGMFAAFAAWGLCLLAVAATSQRRRSVALWGLAAGLVLGYCVMLSYGLPLLGILACTILAVARNWRPIGWAIGAAVAVVLAFAVAGFAWWEGYPVLVQRYWDGIATRRPLGYWIWGNFAALLFSAGPIVGAAIAATIARSRSTLKSTSELRIVVALALAALATVVVADLSGMSKAEVERIWLPFVPWLLVATAILPASWRTGALAGQIAFAVVVQHVLFTGW